MNATDTYPTADLCRAAQAIQPYLKDLLELRHAQNLEQQLNHLVTNAENPQVGAQILAVLQQEEILWQWTHLYLDEHHEADQILPLIRTYHPLSQGDTSIESPRYGCPVASCHREWYRRNLAETVPTCPIHNLTLVRTSKT
jgi:hypothetical protein